ncbi:MAG: hypothetical protein FJX74_02670 [Armatimonadetes bacterium]|nr:hypothetical protein [Armatimonadota bacterium]
MRTAVIGLTTAALLAALGAWVMGAEESLNAGGGGNPYGRWERGLPSDPSFFPIAVWLQDPRNAARYQAAGINLYVGLWKGPTVEQLTALEAVGMPVICDQNQVGLAYQGQAIVAWMHGDEPDNAQALPGGGGWGPPIPPEEITADYDGLRAADPTRPVLLNLGQGVAWDGWYGRGVRTNHPEDYPRYAEGCDIVSFDIYPAVHDRAEVAGNLWFVPKGVDRLREWTADRKIVWNCIECTRISNESVKPTPHQVKAEVWMSLIHGSMGLIYFVHQFRPGFIEAGLLADDEMTQAVTALNRQIHELAPVLNSPSVPGLQVTSANAETPVDHMAKQVNGTYYVFAVAMRDSETEAAFTLPEPLDGRAIVLGENREVPVAKGRFADRFVGYGVHLYRIEPA